MKSKIFFCNRALYRYQLKRYGFVGPLIMVWMLISDTARIFSLYNYQLEMNESYVYEMFPYVSDYFLIVMVSFFLGIFMYRFLYDDSQMALFHSIPISRNVVYKTNFLVFITLYGIPVVVNGLIIFIATLFKLYPISLILPHTFYYVGFVLGSGLLIYTIVVLSGMLVGNTLYQGAISFIFLWMPLTIFGNILYQLRRIGLDIPDWLDVQYMLTPHQMTRQFYRETHNVEIGSMIGTIIGFVVLAMLFYFIGKKQYEKRKMSANKGVFNFNKVHYFLYILVGPGALLYTTSKVEGIFGLVLGIFIATILCVGVHMLNKRTTKQQRNTHYMTRKKRRTIKKKYFHSGLFYYELKKYGIIGIALFFFILLRESSTYLHMETYSEATNNGMYVLSVIIEMYMRELSLMVLMILPIIIGTLSYQFLYNSNQMQSKLAFPVTRSQTFGVSLLVFMLVYGLPTFFNTALSIIWVLSKGYPLQLSLSQGLLQWVGLFLVGMILYGFTVFTSVITGNRIMQIVTLFAIPASFITIYNNVINIMNDNLKGFLSESNMYGFYYFIQRYLLLDYTMLYNGSIIKQVWIVQSIAIMLVLIVLLNIYGLKLFQKRELSNNHNMVFSFVKYVYLIICVPAGGIMTGYWMERVIGHVGLYVGVIIGCALAVPVVNMITDRQFTEKKHVQFMSAFIGVLLILLIVLDTGGLGYEKKQPDITDIESVSVRHNTNINGDWTPMLSSFIGDIVCEEISDIELALELHKELINSEEHWNKRKWIRIQYTMKSGNDIVRYYNGDDYESLLKELVYTKSNKDAVFSNVLTYISDREKYGKSFSELVLKVNQVTVENITEEQYDTFVQIYKSEYDSLGILEQESYRVIGGLYLDDTFRTNIFPIYNGYKKTIAYVESISQ